MAASIWGTNIMGISKKIVSGLVGLVAASLLSSTIQAAPITVPTGLNPGDTYRLVFVTSTMRPATTSNLNGYNAFVTAAANLSPDLVALGTTWTAIVSTIDGDARDNTNTNPFTDGIGTAIYTLSNQLVAQDNSDLWDGSLQSRIDTDESGNPIFSPSIWTGTNQDGTGAIGNYLGFGGQPQIGTAAASASQWVNFGTADRNTFLQFYALSAELVVHSQIPETGTWALFALGLVGLKLARRKRPVSTLTV